MWCKSGVVCGTPTTARARCVYPCFSPLAGRNKFSDKLLNDFISCKVVLKGNFKKKTIEAKHLYSNEKGFRIL
jgi:hypothetical protein